MNRKIHLISKAVYSVFGENDPTPAPVPEPTPAPVPAPTPTDPNPNPNPNPGRTFTQADVNRMIADERRKAMLANNKTVEQLEALRQNVNLTQQEKDNLSAQIETIQNQYKTREEQTRTETERLQKKYDTDTGNLKGEVGQWKTRFESMLTDNAITNAAVLNGAFSPDQIAAILRPKTKITEGIDEKGHPNGVFSEKVAFEKINADGVPVKLELTADQAVKEMKQDIARYGNLFKNTGVPGLGDNNVSGDSSLPSTKNGLSLDAYKAHRKKFMAAGPA